MATGKRILITGGAGFIGYHTVKRMAQSNQVVVLDNLSRPGTKLNLETLRRTCPFEFLQMDVVQTDFVQDLRERIGEVDVIVHLAAQVAVTLSERDPRHDFMTNALGTFNVLEYARSHARKPLVLFASTNKVYGDLESLRPVEHDTRWVLPDFPTGIGENVPLDFHSPYGCSKGCADQYVRDYWRIYGVPTVCFRQSCIYGDQQLGVEDQGWIAWFLIALNLGKPITIYGDGKQVRDALHVNDLVNAYETAINNQDTVSGEIFNIGGGPANTLSLLDFFALVHERLGFQPSLNHAASRSGDQRVFISDNGKIHKVLGWKARTPIAEGIVELNTWIQNNIDTIESVLNKKNERT
jgi:CDP-paratose 2-epimerase